jgi:hypothetical protein
VPVFFPGGGEEFQQDADAEPRESVPHHSSVTESMEKFRHNTIWLKGRKSRHQLQINRKN